MTVSLNGAFVKAAACVICACLCFCTATACRKKEPPTDTVTPTDSVTLCGKELGMYDIVIGEDATAFEEYGAEMLADFISDATDTRLEVTAREGEGAHIYVCDTYTNSQEVGCSYTIEKKDGNIYISGNAYMCAAGCGALAQVFGEDSESGTYDFEGKSVLWDAGEIKNIIFFIGDGMGQEHISLTTDSLAVIEDGSGEQYPEEESIPVFWAQTFPVAAEVKTVNIQGEITDSAAGATALATGCKTKNGVLGMIPADLNGNGEADGLQSVLNVREAACLDNKYTAVLSTDRLTGATPNAFLVHHSYRYDSNTVLEQQKALEKSPVLCPDEVWCSYDDDGVTERLISVLKEGKESERGAFVMCEEAMIDKFASKLDYDNVIRTVKRLNSLVEYAASFAAFEGGTTVIVTADHETGGITRNGNNYSFTSGGDHTAQNVPVYIFGGAEELDGKELDNTDIAKYIFTLTNP